MTKLRMKYGIACLLLAASAYAQTALRPFADAEAVRLNAPRSASLLRDLDSSLEQVVAKVSPAVVQIVVTGYGPWRIMGIATQRESSGSMRLALASSSILTATSLLTLT